MSRARASPASRRGCAPARAPRRRRLRRCSESSSPSSEAIVYWALNHLLIRRRGRGLPVPGGPCSLLVLLPPPPSFSQAAGRSSRLTHGDPCLSSVLADSVLSPAPFGGGGGLPGVDAGRCRGPSACSPFRSPGNWVPTTAGLRLGGRCQWPWGSGPRHHCFSSTISNSSA